MSLFTFAMNTFDKNDRWQSLTKVIACKIVLMVMVCEEVTPTNVTSSVSSSMHILLDSTYVKNLQNAHVVFRILPEEEVCHYHAKIMAFKIVCDITASYCFKKDFSKLGRLQILPFGRYYAHSVPIFLILLSTEFLSWKTSKPPLWIIEETFFLKSSQKRYIHQKCVFKSIIHNSSRARSGETFSRFFCLFWSYNVCS